MNDLSIFEFETNPVRIVTIDERPHWVASDISSILGYRDAPNMVRMLDADQAATHSVSSSGQHRDMLIVTEGGMFTCVIRSKRPEAKRFLRWITDEVLPSIFRTGSYTMAGYEQTPAAPWPALLDDPARINAAIALIREARRMGGPRSGRYVWLALGMPWPDTASFALDDRFSVALLAAVRTEDRLTWDMLARLVGTPPFDEPSRSRARHILEANGWTFKNTKFGRDQRWAWHRPSTSAGEELQ